MGLYENIKIAAARRGYSINRLEKELGFARSSISKFNKNVPGTDKVSAIADFLNIPITELLGLEETDKKELSSKDERDIAKDLENIMAKLKGGENGPATFNGENIPQEDQELFATELELMLRRLKMINKEKYNPSKNKK